MKVRKWIDRLIGVEDLRRRLDLIEKQLAEMKKRLETPEQKTKSSVYSKVDSRQAPPSRSSSGGTADTGAEQSKRLYFEGCYPEGGRICLGKAIPERKSFVRIEGETTGEDTLTYAPISFDDVRQFDRLRDVIEQDPGGVALRNAQRMEIIRRGTAVCEGGLWFVSEKALIRWC